MSEMNKKVPDVRPIPDDLPEELLPLYDWWQANGKTTIITAAIAIVLAVAVYSVKLFCESKVSRANQSLLQANTLEELEQAVAKDGGTKAGNAMRIKLGKAYYDAGRYEDALNAYKTCLSKGAPKGFKEIVEMGIAFSLEGLGKNDEALAAYQAFEKDHTGHFLLPDATMGVARILTIQGKADEAKKLLETLKASVTGQTANEAAITKLEKLIDQYEERAKLPPPAAAPAPAPAPEAAKPAAPAPAAPAAEKAPAPAAAPAPAPAPEAAKPAAPAPAPVTQQPAAK